MGSHSASDNLQVKDWTLSRRWIEKGCREGMPVKIQRQNGQGEYPRSGKIVVMLNIIVLFSEDLAANI